MGETLKNKAKTFLKVKILALIGLILGKLSIFVVAIAVIVAVFGAVLLVIALFTGGLTNVHEEGISDSQDFKDINNVIRGVEEDHKPVEINKSWVVSLLLNYNNFLSTNEIDVDDEIEEVDFSDENSDEFSFGLSTRQLKSQTKELALNQIEERTVYYCVEQYEEEVDVILQGFLFLNSTTVTRERRYRVSEPNNCVGDNKELEIEYEFDIVSLETYKIYVIEEFLPKRLGYGSYESMTDEQKKNVEEIAEISLSLEDSLKGNIHGGSGLPVGSFGSRILLWQYVPNNIKNQLTLPLPDYHVYRTACYGFYNTSRCKCDDNNRAQGLHRGGDYGRVGNSNVPIYAVAEGYIHYRSIESLNCETASECDSNGIRRGGNSLILRHYLEDGKVHFSRYAHLDSFSSNYATAELDTFIRQGEQIGDMGNTGHSTGPHLHFEFGYFSSDKSVRYLYNTEELTERFNKTSTFDSEECIKIRDKCSGKILSCYR